ncbi:MULTISPECIES: restriction endonuclease [Streptomyces]|uniref:restriction endonuclease n=1 Tax=Streptomyces TaxID=1883 RepID=UPI0036B12B98
MSASTPETVPQTMGRVWVAVRKRRRSVRKRRERRLKMSLIGGSGSVVLLIVFWQAIWPYLVGLLVLGLVAIGGWWLWRTDRLVKGRDRQWRQEQAVKAGHRTLNEVDAMSGGEFEDFIVELCRRDGCTEVRRVGGPHDDGADVLGRLPDGRSMVIQCKRYSPKSRIPSREVRDLLGAQVHCKADVAIFVTTTYFTGPSERTAVQNGVIAVHRDHLGLWNNGASLVSFNEVNGSGQGNRTHRARWKATYE